MSDPGTTTRAAASAASGGTAPHQDAPPGPVGEPTGEIRKILCLCDDASSSAELAATLGPAFDVTPVRSIARAVTRLAKGDFSGVYAEASHFGDGDGAAAAQLMLNVQMLRGMADGVVLLNRDNTIVWGNGRLREWTRRETVIGDQFYAVLDAPEILGPELQPFDTAFSRRERTASTLRCDDGRYFRIHAAPVDCFDDESPEHLVVTIRDVTIEQQEQQKLNAIHLAGIELADLTPEEVAEMDVEERVELLKSNILHCTQDVLQYDVVEVRTLDEATGELRPLLAFGIKPEAVQRSLRCETTGNGVTGFVASTGKSYVCEDTGEDPLYIEGASGARSSLTVPLLLQDRVIGTFNVESPESSAFTERDRQFLEIFTRDVAAALNTMELLAAEKATTAVASIEAIHSAVAMPVDDILNDAINLMEMYPTQEPALAERLEHILRNARDIKRVIQDVGRSMAPTEARPACVRVDDRPLLVGKRVLVADEDGAIRSAAHDLLERYGCIVETAHDGAEAISMARHASGAAALCSPYDAILADIRLPDLSGYELLQKLQACIGPPPLILMTGFGYDPGHVIVKARQAGLKAVLFKPFRLDQLLETVEQVVGEDVKADT